MTGRFEEFFPHSIDIFRHSLKDAIGLCHALLAYLKMGTSFGFSQGELIDFLGVSSPSILESSGLNESEQDLAMSILGDISDHELRE